MAKIKCLFLMVCTMTSCRCLGLDTVQINFNDVFYRELLKDTIPSGVYDPNELSETVMEEYRQGIEYEALKARQQYRKLMAKWTTANAAGHIACEDVVWLLVHKELNEKTLLTFGQVVGFLGLPDDIYFAGYSFNGDSLCFNDERFFAIYGEQNIRISFSVTGFVKNVSANGVGISKPRWPHRYDYCEKRPICCDGIQANEQLQEAIEAFIKAMPSYWSWVGYMSKWPQDYVVRTEECQADIQLVDRITDDLALCVFGVSSKHGVVFCDTWWKRNGNQWIPQSDTQITALFRTKN